MKQFFVILCSFMTIIWLFFDEEISTSIIWELTGQKYLLQLNFMIYLELKLLCSIFTFLFLLQLMILLYL
jgi:hypothetical protein